MPGRGDVRIRDYTDAEVAALVREAALMDIAPETLRAALGERTVDVYLNPDIVWVNVPERVWDDAIGGRSSARAGESGGTPR